MVCVRRNVAQRSGSVGASSERIETTRSDGTVFPMSGEVGEAKVLGGEKANSLFFQTSYEWIEQGTSRARVSGANHIQ